MAAMPIYGKKKKKHLKLFFSRTKKVLGLNLGIRHWGLKVDQFCSNDDPRLTYSYLLQDQIGVPMHLYGENIEKSFSQKVLKING